MYVFLKKFWLCILNGGNCPDTCSHNGVWNILYYYHSNYVYWYHNKSQKFENIANTKKTIKILVIKNLDESIKNVRHLIWFNNQMSSHF